MELEQENPSCTQCIMYVKEALYFFNVPNDKGQEFLAKQREREAIKDLYFKHGKLCSINPLRTYYCPHMNENRFLKFILDFKFASDDVDLNKCLKQII